MEKYVSLYEAVKILGPLDVHFGAQVVSEWRKEKLLPVLNLVEPDEAGHRGIDLVAVSDLPVLARLIENSKLKRGEGRQQNWEAVQTLAALPDDVQRKIKSLTATAKTLDEIREARADGYKHALAAASKALKGAERELTDAKSELGKAQARVAQAEAEAVKLQKAVHRLNHARQDFRELEYENLCRVQS
jgi:hypothetical protein